MFTSLCEKCLNSCKQETVSVVVCPDFSRTPKQERLSLVNVLEQRSVLAGKTVVRIPAQFRDTELVLA